VRLPSGRRSVALLLVGLFLSAPVSGRVEDSDSGVEFVGELGMALRLAAAEGKPVAVFFEAVWCPVCTRMRRETFLAAELAPVADRYIWARVDIDRALSTARDYGVEATPTIFLLDPAGRRRVRLHGMQTAAELRDSLESLLVRLDEPAGEPIDGPTRGAGSDLTWIPSGYRSSAICFSNVGYGPLSLYAQSPFQSVRIAMRPRAPSTLGRGELQLRGTATWVNIWNVDDPDLPVEEQEFFLDTEVLQVVLSLAYGITDRVQIEGELQDRSRFGGIMDGLIEGFHDLFGIDQNGRDLYPRNRLHVQLRPQDLPPVVLGGGDRGYYTRSVQTTLQQNITCGTTKLPAVSYSVTARYEALDVDLAGGSPWDFGASVAASRRFGRSFVYATLGYGWFGRSDLGGIELENTQLSWMLAGEWRLATRVSLLLQLLRTEGLIRDLGPFSKPSNEVALGLKWEVRDRGTLELGLLQNVIEFDNSPDFGLHAGFSQRF
jgi:hypothetical protein